VVIGAIAAADRAHLQRARRGQPEEQVVMPAGPRPSVRRTRAGPAASADSVAHAVAPSAATSAADGSVRRRCGTLVVMDEREATSGPPEPVRDERVRAEREQDPAPPARVAVRRRGRRRVALGLTAVAVGVTAAVVALRMGDVLRGTPIQGFETDPAAGRALPAPGAAGFASFAATTAGTPLEGGHRVEVVPDARAIRRIEEDLRSATRSITVLLYYCEPGRVGERWGATLAERAQAGVRVFLVGDHFGCGALLDELAEPLERAGVRVAVLRPVRWYSLHRAQHRVHARAVVIDGRVAWTGGFGLADEWSGEAGAAPWRDTNVRFTGPAVERTQGVFVAAWAEATGRLFVGEELFGDGAGAGESADPDGTPGDAGTPAPAEPGVRAGLLYSAPGLGTRPAERHTLLSLAAARRTIRLTNAYFVPPAPVRRLLRDAARRGVDVRVLVPGPRTDIPSIRWAGRGYYDELLADGVRIFEYQPTMIHAKTMVIDGVWSTVGSLNLDNRSLRLNDESALLVLDPGVGAVLDSLFLADLEQALEVTRERHRARPWWQRIVEGAARAVAPLM
jgi:cardiolipin synthase